MAKLKILMLEDNALDAELIKETLVDQNFDFISKLVGSEKEFVNAIHDFNPDVILSDYSLPQLTGFEALKIAEELAPNTPFIIVTGSLAEETAADSIKLGAWDYVVKQRLFRLESAINNCLKLRKEKLRIQEAEKYMEENTQKLNLMINRSPVGVFTTNQKGEFLSINPAYCEMLGYSADELLEKKFSDITHPEDKEENRILFTDLVKQKIHTYDIEKRYIKKNGETIHTFLRSQLVIDGDGKPLFELAICEDVTQQKRAKNELSRSEMRMKAIFRDALDVIVIVDFENGNILDINNAVENILGYKKEMLIGNPFFTLFPPETDKSRKQLFKELKIRDAVFESQDFMRKDGSICPMDLSITKIPWGENEAALANLRDVTERSLAEKRVQKDLKEKEVMLMEIHHRVKNNLQIISSMLKMQSAYIKDEEALEYFKDSQNRVKTMSLIHESLYQSEDLSKINLKRYIKKLMNQLIISFRDEKKNIKMIRDIDEIFFNINKTIPLGLLINEIVSNSFKYAFHNRKDGEIKISLKKKGKIHTLVIADNGVSMPEHLDIENTNSLGLHLVNALISQLHGKLRLNRKNGTSYKIEFDLEPEKIEAI